jgi:hypothetical protein
MMNNESKQTIDIAVTASDLAKWRSRLSSIEAEISALRAEQARLEEMVALANKLASLMGVPIVQTQDNVGDKKADEGSNGSRRFTITTKVLELINAAGKSTISDLRSALSEFVPEDQRSEGDKGFYHAIRRLAARGEIVKAGLWCLSKEYADSHRGEIPRLKNDTYSGRPSPLADAIKEFLEKNQGVRGAEVIAYLETHDEFGESIRRNATGGYNVLSRLRKRGEIVKEGDKYYIA